MKIKIKENAILLIDDENKLYIERHRDGFDFELYPKDNNLFIVNNYKRGDSVQNSVHIIFETFIAELFGRFVMEGMPYYNDKIINLEECEITFMSDSTSNEFIKFIYDRDNRDIDIYFNIVTSKWNRVAFYFDCNLHEGYFIYFNKLFAELQELALREQNKPMKRTLTK